VGSENIVAGKYGILALRDWFFWEFVGKPKNGS
jgi:hypothetical protein